MNQGISGKQLEQPPPLKSSWSQPDHKYTVMTYAKDNLLKYTYVIGDETLVDVAEVTVL